MFNNMIVTLQPVSLLPERQFKSVKMDTNRDRMTGGRMVTGRPTHVPLPPAHKLKHQVERMEEDENCFNNHYKNQTYGKKPLMVAGLSEKQSGRGPVTLALAQGCPLIIPETNIGTTLYDDQGRQILVCPPWIQLTVPQQNQNSLSACSCQKKTRRCSSSSSSSSAEELGDLTEPPRSPRDHQRSPCEGQPRAPSPPLPPRGEKNCYENIPVPGIIPIAKATCPSPQPTENSSHKDLISLYSRLSGLNNEKDEERIRLSWERLQESGFFYESISAQEAKVKLRSCQVGTFLVRVSSQATHWFALSVKTNRGTTSIRIAFSQGSFRLDADPDCISKMPAFSCIVALIEYYVVQSGSDARNKCVFLESNGRRDTPVILTRPLKGQPQSLKHLCRRNIHYHLSKEGVHQFLEKSRIPISLQTRQYLEKYPYAL